MIWLLGVLVLLLCAWCWHLSVRVARLTTSVVLHNAALTMLIDDAAKMNAELQKHEKHLAAIQPTGVLWTDRAGKVREGMG